MSREIYLRLANDVDLDEMFFKYQEGNLSKRKLCQFISDTLDSWHTSQMKEVLERVLPEEKILQIFYNHYWDSLEKDKGIIDKHCEYLAQVIRKVIDEELAKLEEK